jgi:hypothetical protein
MHLHLCWIRSPAPRQKEYNDAFLDSHWEVKEDLGPRVVQYVRSSWNTHPLRMES